MPVNPITVDAANSYYENGYTTAQLASESGQSIPDTIDSGNDLVDWWGQILDRAIKAAIAAVFWQIMSGG